MPKYFFDIIDDGRLMSDLFGIDLQDDQEARDQAIAILPDLARDELPNGDQHAFLARARNMRGEIVYEANLSLNGIWWPPVSPLP